MKFSYFFNHFEQKVMHRLIFNKLPLKKTIEVCLFGGSDEKNFINYPHSSVVIGLLPCLTFQHPWTVGGAFLFKTKEMVVMEFDHGISFQSISSHTNHRPFD